MSCIIFGPYTIDETVIVSGPPDAEAQVYDASTTYATGDEVWYSGNAWRSKVDSNTGNTPTAGANWADLGEVDEGASAWASGTTYALSDYAIHNHRIWKSTEGSNTGNEPSATATQWQDFGPTNRYRAFDENLARFSTSIGSLKWVFNFPSRVLQCVAFGLSGADFTLTKTKDATEFFENDTALIRDGGGAYYNYWFTPRETKTELIAEDIPAQASEQITVEISAADDAAVSVSGLHFGFGFQVGPVVTGGTGLSGRGFTQIEFDQFGNRVSPARPKQKVTRFATRPIIKRSSIIDREMNALLKEPCVAFMRDGEDYGLLAWGLLDAYDIEMPNPVIAELVVKIQGFPR